MYFKFQSLRINRKNQVTQLLGDAVLYAPRHLGSGPEPLPLFLASLLLIQIGQGFDQLLGLRSRIYLQDILDSSLLEFVALNRIADLAIKIQVLVHTQTGSGRLVFLAVGNYSFVLLLKVIKCIKFISQ